MAMMVSERTPWRAGSALKDGRSTMVRSGTKWDKFVAFGTDQQGADEQRVPGQFGIDPRLDPVFGIGTAIEILREQVHAARMRNEVVIEQLKLLGRELAVILPPNSLLGQRIADGVFVLRAAAGVDAGLGAERAALNERAFAGGDGMFVECGFSQVPMNRSQALEAEFVGAEFVVPQTRFLHRDLPHTWPALFWVRNLEMMTL